MSEISAATATPASGSGDFRVQVDDDVQRQASSASTSSRGRNPPAPEEEGTGLTSSEAERLREEYGFNEIADRSKRWYEVLWEQLYGEHWYPNNIPAMMWIAIIVSLAIQDWIDAGVVLALHLFNSFLGFHETMKAGDAVAALRGTLAPKCQVFRDNLWAQLPARELVPGDIVWIKAGDIIPADGEILDKGTMDVDQSGLTGESLPVKKHPNDTVFSGTVVKRGEQRLHVTKIGENTELGKGAALIQSVHNKSQVDTVMNKITLLLLVFALVFNLILAVVEVQNNSISLVCTSTSRAIGCESSKTRKILSNLVVLFIATIPIATPVVVNSTMAVGARRMAAEHAVVTRLSAIEELAGMTVLCSDKTGTLTKNVLTIDEPFLLDCPSNDELVFRASLAATTVDPDAIDFCCRKSVKDQTALDSYQQLDFVPFDPVTKYTEATLQGPDGKRFKVRKGAPQAVVDLAYNADEIRQQVDDAVVDFAGRGLRPVAVAQTDETGRWVFLGLMSLFDPPRDDSAETIEQAIDLGISVKMITGDHLLIAKETCRRLGLGAEILTPEVLDKPHRQLRHTIEHADGFAQVYPEHKFDVVSLFQENGHITGMTGDGVNDAPALRKANIGFAVDGATQAAQGAAAVILLTPGISVIITAIKNSRKIFQRLQNYLTYRVFLSVFLLGFFFVAIIWARLNFPPVIIIIMCIVFDLATLSLAFDKVESSQLPNKWNLGKISLLALVLAIVAIAGALFFLALVRDNHFNLAEFQRGMSTPCSYGFFYDSGSGCSRDRYLGADGTIGGWCEDNYDARNAQATSPEIYASYVWPPCPPDDLLIKFGLLSNGTAAAFAALRDYYTSFGDKVPDDFTLIEAYIYKPEHFPYSQAVENSIMFLVLSLIAQLCVFLTRIDTWFWKRRPGVLLIIVIVGEMVATTLVVALMRDYQFWSPDASTSSTYVRLTRIDGAYVGIIWLYSLVVAFVMELTKVGFYHAWDRFFYTHEEGEVIRKKTMEESRRKVERFHTLSRAKYELVKTTEV